MPRVLFVTRAFGHNAGGMERLSFELYTNVSKAGTVLLIASPASRLWLPFFIFFALLRVLWQARTADVLYLGDPLLSSIGWVAQRLTRIPVVVTVHGLDVLYPHPLYQWYLRRFFRKFSGYVAISPYVKKILQSWGVSSRCIVIPPGVTDELFDPNLTNEDLARVLYQNSLKNQTGDVAGVPRRAPDVIARRRTGVKTRQDPDFSVSSDQDIKDRFVLATIGRLVPRKGHVWFITHVLPALPQQTLYVIAGSGKEERAIARAVVKAGQQNKVRLLGRVNDEARTILFNTIDAFVQPNISVPHDAEGFGLVLLEAALCQRPVFAAHLEGIPAAIIDGKNGCLLQSGNAAAWIQKISDYIARPETYLDAARQARGYTLAQFNWERAAMGYLDFFQSVTSTTKLR